MGGKALKVGKTIALILVAILIVGVIVATDSMKKQEFHGVEYKMRESWIKEELNTSMSDENWKFYYLPPIDKISDGMNVYFVETDIIISDLENQKLIDEVLFERPYSTGSITKTEMRKIKGKNVMIVDTRSKEFEGYTVSRAAIAQGENGLVVIEHYRDSKEDFPKDKEFEKLIKSIESK